MDIKKTIKFFFIFIGLVFLATVVKVILKDYLGLGYFTLLTDTAVLIWGIYILKNMNYLRRDVKHE